MFSRAVLRPTALARQLPVARCLHSSVCGRAASLSSSSSTAARLPPPLAGAAVRLALPLPQPHLARAIHSGALARPGALASPPVSVRSAILGSSRRLLSSSTGPQSPPRAATATIGLVGQAASWVRHNYTIVAVAAGAGLVMYGFYRASMRIMHFFFNVTDKQIFNLGFLAGLAAAAAIAASVVYATRRMTFRVEDVYRAALRELRKYEGVNEAMGGAWRPTGFRGYAVESISDAVKGSDRRARSSFLEAPARRVQMIFMLQGIERDAMVSLEAHKRAGAYHFDMLSLDTRPKRSERGANEAGEHIFLAGEKDHALFDDVAEIFDAMKK